MDVVELQGAEDFRERARDFLMAHEAANNLILGLTHEQVTSPRYDEHLLLAVEDDSGMKLAAVQTPPHNLVISTTEDPSTAAQLAEWLAARGLDLPGVTGPVEGASAFAEKWAEIRGGARRTLMAQRIFMLSRVRPPAPVAGRLRAALEPDMDLVTEWLDAFYREADPASAERSREATRQAAAGFFKSPERRIYLWEDGEPVSMAAHTGPTPNGIRIGAVYTPPERRRRGYAGACVAALSQKLLDEGRRFCFLYTDLANPTSNHIYQEIGYEPVCDSVMYRFEPG